MYSTVARSRSHTNVTYWCLLATAFSSTPKRRMTRRFFASCPRATARSMMCQASCQLRRNSREPPRDEGLVGAVLGTSDPGEPGMHPGPEVPVIQVPPLPGRDVVIQGPGVPALWARERGPRVMHQPEVELLPLWGKADALDAPGVLQTQERAKDV